MDKLLGKVLFDPKRDHLIFTGDMINKGSDSLGVVDLARSHGASCVRGNHEERILKLRREMMLLREREPDSSSSSSSSSSSLESNEMIDSSSSSSASHAKPSKQEQARELARSLSDEQVRWLEACPLILRVGRIPTMGEVVVVHAGLEAGVELEDQNPFTVMNVRTVNEGTGETSSSRDGTPWAKVFSHHSLIHLFHLLVLLTQVTALQRVSNSTLQIQRQCYQEKETLLDNHRR